MEEWLLWCITCQIVYFCMAEMGQVEVSIVMSLHSRVVLGSKLCGAGEVNSLDWRNS